MIGRARVERTDSVTEELLCCEAASRPYAIRVSDVLGITRAEAIVAGRRLDGRVGTVAHGDTEVPVFSAAARLGLVQTAGADTQGHVVLIDTGARTQGWLFTRILRRVTIDAGGVAPLSRLVGIEARRLFDGLVTVDEQSMLLLSSGGPSPLPAAADPGSLQTGRRGAPGPQDGVSQARPLLIAFSTPALRMPSRTLAAVGITQVREVLKVTDIVPVPRAPRAILGVVPWSGLAVPVVHLADATPDHAKTRVLVVQDGSDAGAPLVLALPIHDDARLHRLAGDCPRIAQPSATKVVHGVFAVGALQVGLVNVAAVAGEVAQRR